ncbi:hypothetical protein ACET3X_007107 [Alternaria dauci]|uniref:Uncharacterized protein n=1 Tax=Alternaria dauci TaxID=48095 RepID=A0ABR3UIC8_9PLEO
MAGAILLNHNEPTLGAAEANLDRLGQLEDEVAKPKTRRTDIDIECHKLSRPVAMKLCRTFANKFYTTLPCELREMVYNYVWDGLMLRLAFDDVALYGSTSGNSREPASFPRFRHRRWEGPKAVPWAIPCTQDGCRCFDWWELPCWADHQCVGMDVAIEVVKAYYRNTRSLSVEPDHFEDLTALVSRDHFHLGVKPLDHIRRLIVPFCHEVLIEQGKQRNNNLQSLAGLDNFQHHLEVLLDVRVKKGFELTILLTWHAFFIYCMPALERSRTVVDKLLMEGVKVTILAWDTEGAQEYDVSDYYTLSSVDWQRKWIWKVKKDHRRMGFIAHHDDLDTFPIGFSICDDLTDDAEKTAEREEWENDQDKVFLEALAGLTGPTRDVPMSYASGFHTQGTPPYFSDHITWDFGTYHDSISDDTYGLHVDGFL